ncbi:arginine--tRNA ligase [Candidatus Giovannonibacteria bacterium]|nr:arginine--tRNA ligase [Candidatus Giovannonibacteria bacterium]
MIRDVLKEEISRIVLELAGGEVDVKITVPERPENGDYTTNIAFKTGDPEKIAEELRKCEIIREVFVKNKFINIFVKDEVFLDELQKKAEFPKKREKINLEFISANPTGPLTMANGRGGFYGDALANVLSKAGYDVTREYYINDAGNQVRLLGESIEAAEGKREVKEEYYKGEYIKGLVGKSAPEAVSYLLGEIKKSLEKVGIKFDVWFSERELREKKEPEQLLKFLEEKKLLEKRDGATWLGDAVLVKSDGEYTYFLVDLAYHWNKFHDRKFDLAIDIWGADHHGYVERMKKGIESIGVDQNQLTIIIMQLVRLISGGKEVRMSKRAGEFVTMDDLIEDVGVDVARWFFLERSPNTHMDFDLDLAKERSEKNPVFYVQYAHTRMASILSKSNLDTRFPSAFKHASERALAMKILRLPELLADVSRDFQVQRLTTYAYELAQIFSAFYRDVKVIGSEREAELLYLVSKTKETLADALTILGISLPEKM